MSENSRSRFRRVQKPPKITVNKLDLVVLHLVYRYRLLSSRHIVSLVENTSHQAILRRLHLLFHNGLLDRPVAQKRFYQHGSNRPLIYAISTKGASALRKAGLLELDPGHWTYKNSQLKELFVEHRLGISDYFVRLWAEVADGLVLRNEFDLLHEIAQNRIGRVLFRWRVVLGAEYGFKNLGVVPDGVFAIENANTGARAYYFLEYDRGTMPLKRRTMEQTSFYRKLIAYYTSWQQRIPQKEFGWPRFRVLTITSSQKRCDGLVSMTRALNRGRGSGLFLFTTVDALKRADSVFSLPLQVGRDEPATSLNAVK